MIRRGRDGCYGGVAVDRCLTGLNKMIKNLPVATEDSESIIGSKRDLFKDGISMLGKFHPERI